MFFFIFLFLVFSVYLVYEFIINIYKIRNKFFLFGGHTHVFVGPLSEAAAQFENCYGHCNSGAALAYTVVAVGVVVELDPRQC